MFQAVYRTTESYDTEVNREPCCLHGPRQFNFTVRVFVTVGRGPGAGGCER